MAAINTVTKAAILGFAVGLLMLTSAVISMLDIFQRRNILSIDGIVACSQLAISALLLYGSFTLLNRRTRIIYRIACLAGIAFSALAGLASYNRQIEHFGAQTFVYLTSGSVTIIISALFLTMLTLAGDPNSK